MAAELEARLGGARARAVRLGRDERVVRVYFRDATLEADLSPGRGTVTVGRPTEPGEEAEPLPALLAGVEAVRDERVIVMRFRRVRGRKPHPGLILELATNRWNAILTEGPQLRVRKRLRTVRSRPLTVGQPWPHPGAGRAGGREIVDLAEWTETLKAAGTGAREAVLPRMAYLSGLNIGYVLDGAETDPAASFRRWRAMVDMADVRPHLLKRASGLQPYPWPLEEAEAEPADSLLDAMRRARDAGGPGSARPASDTAGRIAAEAGRLERKRAHLRRQLEGAARADAMREDAALILSSLHLIEPGSARATLTGFDGGERTVRLDRRLRPQDQADALFRRAARLERAAAELPRRIEAADRALAGLAALRARHARGEITTQETEAQLPASRAAGASSSRSRGAPPSLPYRVFTSSGGLQIRVGKGARRNDELTFHHSRPSDVWLHARHAGGAHVILRWTSPERPPAADLEEAAILAAVHSGARGSAHVPVDWTRRKWVRKPRRAPPGTVIPDRVQTLFVSPDPSLKERLGS